MNASTLSAGPLNCRLHFADPSLERNARKRYRGFLSDRPSANLLEIFPSADLLPGEDEFDLRLHFTRDGFHFFSSSTDGFFDPLSRSGRLDISASRLDNPATIENALRRLFGVLALCEGFVFLHGAACCRGDEAWVFLGPSGSGKSTAAFFARRGGFGILSDDFILLGGGDTPLVFPSPFFGRVRSGMVGGGPFTVKGIHILHQADHDTFTPVDSLSEKAAWILANIPLAESGDTFVLDRVLPVAERMARSVPLYRMRFTRSPGFLNFLAPGGV